MSTSALTSYAPFVSGCSKGSSGFVAKTGTTAVEMWSNHCIASVKRASRRPPPLKMHFVLCMGLWLAVAVALALADGTEGGAHLLLPSSLWRTRFCEAFPAATSSENIVF